VRGEVRTTPSGSSARKSSGVAAATVSSGQSSAAANLGFGRRGGVPEASLERAVELRKRASIGGEELDMTSDFDDGVVAKPEWLGGVGLGAAVGEPSALEVPSALVGQEPDPPRDLAVWTRLEP
jgi:hypothetical protein